MLQAVHTERERERQTGRVDHREDADKGARCGCVKREECAFRPLLALANLHSNQNEAGTRSHTTPTKTTMTSMHEPPTDNHTLFIRGHVLTV
jgi:hypothetical protein